MANFKEKPIMSSNPNLGRDFKHKKQSNYSRNKIVIFFVIVLGIVTFLYFQKNTTKEQIKNPKITEKKYEQINEYINLDNNIYSIFKFKLTPTIGEHIYVEQNFKKYNLNKLLEKIAEDKLSQLHSTKSIFRDKRHFFAVTAAMFGDDDLPPGLLISKSTKIKSLNLNDGGGNFYLKPNGIFSVSKNGVVKIEVTSDFDDNEEKTFALQSGPMLIYKNQISNSFQTNSNNINIRSAVGISKDELIFVISKSKVSFYQLADFMKNTLNCSNALHLESSNFAFLDFPGSNIKNSFNQDIKIRNLIIIR